MRERIRHLLLTLLAYIGNTEPDQDTAPREIVVHEDITTDVAETLDIIAIQRRDNEGGYRAQIALWKKIEKTHPEAKNASYGITLKGSRFVLVRKGA